MACLYVFQVGDQYYQTTSPSTNQQRRQQRINNITENKQHNDYYNIPKSAHFILSTFQKGHFTLWMSTFQKGHIPKKHIPFWSNSEKGLIRLCAHFKKSTFFFEHIQKRGSFQKKYIPGRAYSILSTFHKGHILFDHIPKRADSKKGAFRFDLIAKVSSYSNNFNAQCVRTLSKKFE